jgi:6-phosphogluconolactonase
MRAIRYFFSVAALASSALAADYLVYAGTYTGPASKGIYVYRFNSGSGQLKSLGLAAETVNPSWVVAHPGGDYLYAANETARGAVTAFRIDRQTGQLKALNQVSSRGAGPCAMAVDHTGRNLLVANYSSGSLALLPIQPDGSLHEASAFIPHEGSSANRERQSKPHAHSTDFSADNRFAVSCDLGLDKVFVYRLDAEKGWLSSNEPPSASVPPGSGPRHFAWHPNGRFAYVINELESTVGAFGWDGATGTLTHLETVASLAKDYSGEKSGAEIHVHPNGKFLYASNRAQASSITVFAIDPAKGTLRQIDRVSSGGKEPRDFTLDPSGAWLLAANQNSNSIVVFRLDPKSGKLTPAGGPVEVGSPVSIAFVK